LYLPFSSESKSGVTNEVEVKHGLDFHVAKSSIAGYRFDNALCADTTEPFRQIPNELFSTNLYRNPQLVVRDGFSIEHQAAQTAALPFAEAVHGTLL
jgi:hypothetical protein